MPFITVAGHPLDEEQALDVFTEYSSRSVLFYDLGGDPDALPAPSNGVSLADIGRMTVINARLKGDDVVALLDAGEDAAWDTVPSDSRFEDVDDPEHGSGLAEAMRELHYHFTAKPGIKQAKAAKLLHLKRPHLYPVLDRFVRESYAHIETDAARRAAIENHYTAPLWAAIQEDLQRNQAGLASLRQTLQASDGHEFFGRLSPVRLLDILAWSLASPAGAVDAE